MPLIHLHRTVVSGRSQRYLYFSLTTCVATRLFPARTKGSLCRCEEVPRRIYIIRLVIVRARTKVGHCWCQDLFVGDRNVVDGRSKIFGIITYNEGRSELPRG